MTPPDCFGQAITDQLRGKGELLKIERDDGYLDGEDVSYYFSGYDDFPECEKRALGHVIGKVLDIGVGAGRVALYLQSRGHEVLGVDISGMALNVCKQRGVRDLARMTASNPGIRRSSFDTAIAFGNGFGLCGTPEGAENMLRRLCEILSSEGVVLAESIDPLRTDNPAHLDYHKANVARGRLPGQIALRYRYGQAVGDWFDILFATPDVMESIAMNAGWSLERIYESPGPRLYTGTRASECLGPATYVGILRKT